MSPPDGGTRRGIGAIVLAAFLAGCGTANPGGAVTPSPTETAATTPAASPTAAPSEDPTACNRPADSGLPHDAPDLEAVLPESVGGRQLTSWSLAGWCWVRFTVPEEDLADFAETAEDISLQVDDMQLALAGRSNVLLDPPFFVHVMWKPFDKATNEMALYFFLGNLGVLDPMTFPQDLSVATVGGKEVSVLDPEFLTQDGHQRGSGYFYDTSDHFYAVTTDDEAWAADALGQLE